MTLSSAHALSLGFEPAVWLGAPAPGGLALPCAMPAADTLYAPRGVWLSDDGLIVADSGNHRVLVWRSMPHEDHAPADFVIGQATFADEGPGLLHLPTGVAVIDGSLVVADAWHHRLLVWNEMPDAGDVPPDHVIGQPDMTACEPNRGADLAVREGFYWPYAFGMASGLFFVADTGNRRVLAWPGLPEPGEPPHWLIGQPDWTARGENADGAVGPLTFRWPHGVAGVGESLYIADAGNHRVLAWRDAAQACKGAEPDAVYGQADFFSNGEWPYGDQSASMHRFPYAISADRDTLVISDTANNRVLLHGGASLGLVNTAADGVLAQPAFTSNGENRWEAVERDTLCWPYGLHLHGDRLAVADSGNNRVMIWRARGADGTEEV